jgi:hypothetical protein
MVEKASSRAISGGERLGQKRRTTDFETRQSIVRTGLSDIHCASTHLSEPASLTATFEKKR